MGYTERIWNGLMRYEGSGRDEGEGPLRLLCVSLCDNGFVFGVMMMGFGACLSACRCAAGGVDGCGWWEWRCAYSTGEIVLVRAC